MKGTFFVKEDFARLLFIASVCIQHIYVYVYISVFNIWLYNSCTIGPKCCVLKKGVRRKKKHTNSKLKGENSSRFYSLVRDIGPAVRVFTNAPGDLGSIPGRVIPKTLKMELDTTLLNTQHYKVRFKGKVEQSREWSNALPYTLV